MIFSGLSNIRDDRTCKALTGVTRDQFKRLLEVFESSAQALRQERYEQGTLRIKHRGGPSWKSRHFRAPVVFCAVLPQKLPDLRCPGLSVWV